MSRMYQHEGNPLMKAFVWWTEFVLVLPITLAEGKRKPIRFLAFLFAVIWCPAIFALTLPVSVLIIVGGLFGLMWEEC